VIEDPALKNHSHGTLTIVVKTHFKQIVFTEEPSKTKENSTNWRLDFFIIIGIKGKEEQFHISHGIISPKHCGH